MLPDGFNRFFFNIVFIILFCLLCCCCCCCCCCCSCSCSCSCCCCCCCYFLFFFLNLFFLKYVLLNRLLRLVSSWPKSSSCCVFGLRRVCSQSQWCRFTSFLGFCHRIVVPPIRKAKLSCSFLITLVFLYILVFFSNLGVYK